MVAFVIPTDYRGCWRRVSITVGDNPPRANQTVMWLQAAHGFGDVRIPLDADGETSCFSGVTTLDRSGSVPRLRWAHDLNLEPIFPADEGDVEWHGDDLHESGEFTIDGAVVPYVEVWRREPCSNGEQVVLTTQAERAPSVFGRWVRVGDHSLLIVDRRAAGGAFTARYLRRDPAGVWREALALGDEPIKDSPPDATTLRAGDHVAIGDLQWHVDEAATPNSF
ncbi:MAG: hypothetical protein JWL83_713 [Actinomycetia bacterium]|nr:hypothetical protein [Actinomycetes bacterium]